MKILHHRLMEPRHPTPEAFPDLSDSFAFLPIVLYALSTGRTQNGTGTVWLGRESTPPYPCGG